jgi:hypothetical protein
MTKEEEMPKTNEDIEKRNAEILDRWEHGERCLLSRLILTFRKAR